MLKHILFLKLNLKYISVHFVKVTIHNVVYNWGCHPYNLRLNAHAVRKARQTGQAISDPVEKFLTPEMDTNFI
jgi:hypothetical protein